MPSLFESGESVAREIVDDAARRYFAERRARVGGFIDRHFTLQGSLALHRHALGWDVARAPVNLALALPNVGAKMAAVAADKIGAPRAAAFLRSRDLQLPTDVGRRIEWLVMTELLELPFQQGERVSKTDALAHEILSDPRLEEAVAAALGAIGRRADDAAFRARLEETIAAYAGTRLAAAEITTALLTLGAGFAVVHKATPGMMTLAPLLASTLAHKMAVAAFPLGASLGGVWYGLFPAAAPAALTAGLAAGLVAGGTILTAFAGVVADPVQRQLGIHRRRLLRLIDVAESRFFGHEEAAFTTADQYVARLLDLVDLLGSAYRLARA